MKVCDGSFPAREWRDLTDPLNGIHVVFLRLANETNVRRDDLRATAVRTRDDRRTRHQSLSHDQPECFVNLRREQNSSRAGQKAGSFLSAYVANVFGPCFQAQSLHPGDDLRGL